jgi:hypothetical protein
VGPEDTLKMKQGSSEALPFASHLCYFYGMARKIKIRRKTLFIWMAIVVATLVLYYMNRELFDITFLRKYVSDHKVLVLCLYLAILTFIGLTFIPSTPFAVAGVLLFTPLEAYLINLTGIITSSVVVYYFTKYLRLDIWLESKYPVQIEKDQEGPAKKGITHHSRLEFFSSGPYRPDHLCEQQPQNPLLEMCRRDHCRGRHVKCVLYLLPGLLFVVPFLWIWLQDKKTVLLAQDGFALGWKTVIEPMVLCRFNHLIINLK